MASKAPLVVVDLGAGKGERIGHLQRGLMHGRIAGADLSLPARARRSVTKQVSNRSVRFEPVLSHLQRYGDNSVDHIGSDMCVGYYTERGALDTDLDADSYGTRSLTHLRDVARLAFHKLKTTPQTGGRSPPKKYFVLRLQYKLNFRRIVEILEGVGFKVNYRDTHNAERSRTRWLRRLSGYRNLVTVYAYKPARS